MIYIHWIYLLLYMAIMIPAIITVLIGQPTAREDDGVDSCARFHAFRGNHLLHLLRAEHTRKERLMSDKKHGPVDQALDAGICRAGESAYPSQQQAADESLYQSELGIPV